MVKKITIYIEKRGLPGGGSEDVVEVKENE